MTVTSDAKRQRYSRELAAYTLRQFAAARALLDQRNSDCNKGPTNHLPHETPVNSHKGQRFRVVQPASPCSDLPTQRNRARTSPGPQVMRTYEHPGLCDRPPPKSICMSLTPHAQVSDPSNSHHSQDNTIRFIDITSTFGHSTAVPHIIYYDQPYCCICRARH